MKQKRPTSSTALQGTGLTLGQGLDGLVLDTPVAARAASVSPQRLRLVRVRLAKLVGMHAAASDDSILAAYQRRLMRADPKRYPVAGACTKVTGFIARALRGERGAVDALKAYAPQAGRSVVPGDTGDVLPASFGPSSPRDNPELSGVMLALS